MLHLRGAKCLSGQPGEIGAVVFSKDRPAQLDALLRSADDYLIGDLRWIVLWRASLPRVEEDYRDFLVPRERRGFVQRQESLFRQDLLAVLDSLKGCRAIMFLVDDLLFVRPLETATLAGVDLRRCVPSLRLGRNITFCQPKDLATSPPVLRPIEARGWLDFSWTASDGDWAMPLSLDGNIFARDEIRALASLTEFRAPNSFEASLGDFRFLFKHRRGLCLEHPVLVNFAFNRVQAENDHFPCGEFGAAEFVSRWRKGWWLDVNSLAEKGRSATGCHLITEPVFERRPSSPL